MPTAIAGTTATVACDWVPLLLPRWLGSWVISFGTIGTSLALLMGIQLLATGWVVAATLVRSTGSVSPTGHG